MNMKIVTLAIALYTAKGVIEALAYLHSVGFSTEDGVALLALYDDATERVANGDYLI